MPNPAHLKVRLAWCRVPIDADSDAISLLVASCGGRLLSVAWQVGIGRYATAFGLDDNSLEFLASIVPPEGGCPN